jgi:hypothetical protein
MKKLFLFTTAMFLGICDLISQCSFAVNEVDKFTNTRKIETKLEVLHRDFNSTLGFSFCNYDSLFFVKVSMNFSDLIYSIQKGSEMILITEKGNKLILSSLENELASGFSEISYLIKVDDLKKSKSGESENRSSDGRSRRGKSPGRRRKKDVLEREETDSIISSVSTHRSGKSSYTNKTAQSSKSKKSSKSNGFELTKEALDKLNNINQGTYQVDTHTNGKDNTPRSPQQKKADSNKSKQPATTTPTSWWGLF